MSGAPTTGDSLNITRDERITLPSQTMDDWMGVRRLDWARLKRDVQSVKEEWPFLVTVASGLIGFAASAAIAALQIASVTGSPPWLGLLFGISAVFAAIAGAVFLVLHRQMSKGRVTKAKEIEQDMIEIERTFASGKP